MSGIPDTVFAMIDLYGKCVQTTVMNRPDSHSQPRPLLSKEPSLSKIEMLKVQNPLALNRNTIETNLEEESASAVSTPSSSLQDRLRFHHRCGSMVKLSNGQRTAERRRPLDEFNNGVVMTQRPLLPDELFEIRIDSLVDKWSGSIEVGITTHNPAALNFPSTMTNLRSGTVNYFTLLFINLLMICFRCRS